MSTSVSSVVSHFPSAENGFTTTLASTISSGAATVPLNSLAGYTNGEIAVFVVDPTDASKKQTFTGVVDTAGVQLTSVVWTAGTNQSHSGGATVVDYATATHISMITKGILVEHNQDGTHDEAIITSRTEDTTPALGDLLLTSDASASNVLKKVSVSNLWVSAGGILGATDYYTYDGTDIFVNGVDQNNASNAITWNKPSNFKYVIVEVVGGGGAGGGAATTNGTQHSVGGGGGGGGYSRKKIAAASLGATETVTVGAGATGDNDGGATGGTSSFGSHCSGAGGVGGTSSGAAATSGGAVAVGGAGGAGASGDLNINGGGGLPGFTITNALNIGHPGDGGSSVYAGISRIGGFSTAGVAGNNYGGGGAGAGNTISQSARAGGNGANGLVIVHYYF